MTKMSTPLNPQLLIRQSLKTIFLTINIAQKPTPLNTLLKKYIFQKSTPKKCTIIVQEVDALKSTINLRNIHLEKNNSVDNSMIIIQEVLEKYLLKI